VVDLHERGAAAPSATVLEGRTVIRAAIVNHRTTCADMDAFLAALQVSALRAAAPNLVRPTSRSHLMARPERGCAARLSEFAN
jgi:hypothetical protein